MADIFSPQKRSAIMSKISGTENQLEILVRKYLFSLGFRFRKNDRRFPGKPDIILPKYKIAIFIHGCFWHGHKGCKKSTLPTTHHDFWETKIDSNKARDLKNSKELKNMGWKVLTIWGCQLSTKKRARTFSMLIDKIK
jgi:DNA mismatch endonuclease, patch repair protein